MSHQNLKYLDVQHQLIDKVREIKGEADLRHHLRMRHSIRARNKSLSMLAREHLFAHTLEAFPELRDTLGIGASWGRGS